MNAQNTLSIKLTYSIGQATMYSCCSLKSRRERKSCCPSPTPAAAEDPIPVYFPVLVPGPKPGLCPLFADPTLLRLASHPALQERHAVPFHKLQLSNQ